MKRAQKKAKKSHASVGRGRPPVEHQFKAGNPGNPRGRPRITPEQRRAKSLLLQQYPRFVIDYLTMPSVTLMGRLKDANTCPAERLFLASVFKAIQKGDFDVFLKIMNKMVGAGAVVLDDRGADVRGRIGFEFGVPPAPGTLPGDDRDVQPQIIVYIPSNGREVRSLLESTTEELDGAS